MDTEELKFLYASAPGGQRAKIPLLNKNFINTVEVIQYLNNEGVKDNDLPFVTFSMKDPGPLKLQLRSDFQSVLADDPPPYPEPSAPNDALPIMSDIKILSRKTLKTLDERGIQYAMARAGGGYENVLAYDKENFVDSKEYDNIHDGTLALGYGLAWRQVTNENILEGVSYTNENTVKTGQSQEESLEISATLGVSYSGVSASLTTTFGRKVTITEEQSRTENYKVEGIAGKILNFALWQLVEVFTIERKVAGTWSRDSDFKVTLKGKNNSEYFLYDRFDGTMNGLDIVNSNTKSFDV